MPQEQPIDAPASDPNFMMSLARGLSVIQAFSEQRPSMTVSQISQRTGISRAAVRRCLYTLDKLGFVNSLDGGVFSLRPRVLLLGQACLTSIPFARAAEPVLNRLSEPLNESSSVSVLDGNEVLYVARAQTKRLMAMHLDVGSRLPAIYTAMGRVLIAALPSAERETYITNANYNQHTAHSIMNRQTLGEALGVVREQGYCIVDQELEEGVRSIAVPVTGRDGAVIAAMSVGVHAQRMGIEAMESQILPALKNAAQELSLLGEGLQKVVSESS